MAGRVHDATPFLLGGKELALKQYTDLSSHTFSKLVLSHFRARRGAGGRSGHLLAVRPAFAAPADSQ